MSNISTMAIRGTTICLCLLVLYIGATSIVQKGILAIDKSSSITCNGNLPCEKTVCVDGDCETTISNSSQISSTQPESIDDDSESIDDDSESIDDDSESIDDDSESIDDDSDHKDSDIRNLIEDRMSLREK